MKNIFLLASIIVSSQLCAQLKETYYDYKWEPCKPAEARFYSTVEKTDSGWLRNDYFVSNRKLQMRALYEDSACSIYNGPFVYFYPNGKVSYTGKKIHDKEEGICVHMHSNGMMADSGFYRKGALVGASLKWWPNGVLSDSLAQVNDTTFVSVSWFDNGNVSEAGYYIMGKMQNKWKFYHRNGQLAAAEIYNRGKMVSAQYYNEDGSIKKDTSGITADAMVKGNTDTWLRYISKKIEIPYNIRRYNNFNIVAVLNITINEEGKIENAEVVVPIEEVFDKALLDAIHQNTIDFKPAISHNRKIKTTFRQRAVFKNEL